MRVVLHRNKDATEDELIAFLCQEWKRAGASGRRESGLKFIFLHMPEKCYHRN